MEKQITFKQYLKFVEIVEQLNNLRDELLLSKSNNKKGGFNGKYSRPEELD